MYANILCILSISPSFNPYPFKHCGVPETCACVTLFLDVKSKLDEVSSKRIKVKFHVYLTFHS